MLSPDAMSADLRNHFAQYDQAKHSLMWQLNAQDQEFGRTVGSLARQVDLPKVYGVWREIDAMSYVEKCVGPGNGVVLKTRESGFNFEYWGVSGGGSGTPSPDQIAAFRAFNSIKATPDVIAECTKLRDQARALSNDAANLSKEAELLSKSTILPGTCEFLTSRSLTD
jgi:hypothetical protein